MINLWVLFFRGDLTCVFDATNYFVYSSVEMCVNDYFPSMLQLLPLPNSLVIVFAFDAPPVGNALPDGIRESPSIDSFSIPY